MAVGDNDYGYPSPSPTPWWVFVLGALAVLLLVGVYAAGAELFYGDWRCAFAQCRLVKQ